MPKLTNTFAKGVEQPAEGYKIHWDDKVPGYGLKVTATGVKSFMAQGRVNGKVVNVTIGRFPLYTEDQARKRALSALQRMRDGINPNAEKKAAVEAAKAEEAAGVTLAQVCAAYLDRPGKLKQKTKDEYQRHVDKSLAEWKGLPIASITADMVVKRHREIVQKGIDGKRGAPASANSAMTVLRLLIKFASRQYRQADGSPLILYNPTDALHDHWAKLGTRTQRYIERDKVGETWNALTTARANAKNRADRHSVDLVRLLVLTGARRSEIAGLEWSRVDLKAGLFHLPDPKNGREVYLPLSRQAVELLEQVERVKGSSFVFPSQRGHSKHITDPRAAMQVVSDTVGRHLSLHDLRRSYTNIAMRECRIGKFETDLLTGHVPAAADVTSRNYLDLTKLDWLRPETQKVSDWIEQQALVAAGANVVALPATA